MREARVKPAAWFARRAVTYAGWKNNEVFGRFQQLPASEEHAGKARVQKVASAPARAVHDEHGVSDHTIFISHGSSDGRVMQLEFRQRPAAFEVKITNDKIALHGRWISGRCLSSAAILSKRNVAQKQ